MEIRRRLAQLIDDAQGAMVMTCHTLAMRLVGPASRDAPIGWEQSDFKDPEHRVHQAIADLNPGDSLQVRMGTDRGELLADNGMSVKVHPEGAGALKKSVSLGASAESVGEGVGVDGGTGVACSWAPRSSGLIVGVGTSVFATIGRDSRVGLAVGLAVGVGDCPCGAGVAGPQASNSTPKTARMPR